MRINEELTPKNGLKESPDFNQELKGAEKVSGIKSYLDYPQEERIRLGDSIRIKRKTNEPLSAEEINFQEADKVFWREDDQERHGH